MNFETFIRIEDCLTSEEHARILASPRPVRLCGRRIPESLDGLTLGQLARLRTEGGLDGILHLFRLSARKVAKSRAENVVGLLVWVNKELERISKLFAQTEVKPTREEQEARAGMRDFGFFGLADWYARRMGYKDQEDVFSLPWMRIYQCMMIDAEAERYNRKLRTIYEKQGK